MKLAGRVAIVTGGGQGIGREIALGLARAGARVLVTDLNSATAERVAGEINSLGQQATARSLDVRVKSQVDGVVAHTVQEMGRLDIMVNNAGIVHVKPFVEITEQESDEVFAVNVKGVLFGTQAAAREMIKQQSGRIINTSSVAAKFARPMLMAYAASKATVISITRSAALALAPYQVRVNALCPGAVDTAQFEKSRSDLISYGDQGEAIPLSPLGRIGRPEDIAKVAVFLASDDSDYMTGQAINISGGTCMH